MRYIHNTLLQSEECIYLTRPHWVVFVSPIFSAIFGALVLYYGPQLLQNNVTLFGFTLSQLVAGFMLIMALFWLISATIMYQFTEYGVTNKRVILKTGLIQRRSLEIFLDKVEAVRVDQSVLGRLLGYGSIIVVGTGGTGDPFPYIPDPLGFRKRVQQQIDFVLNAQQNGS